MSWKTIEEKFKRLREVNVLAQVSYVKSEKSKNSPEKLYSIEKPGGPSV